VKKMADWNDKIKDAVSRRARLGNIPETVYRSAVDIMTDVCPLAERIGKDGCITLTDGDVGRFVERVDLTVNTRLGRWRRKQALNNLVFDLSHESILRSPYIRIPAQVPRPLAVDLTVINSGHMELASRLRAWLCSGALLGPPDPNALSPGLWHFISLHCLLSLDGVALSPWATDAFFSITDREIDLETGWVWLPADRRKSGAKKMVRRPLPISPEFRIHLLRSLEKYTGGNRRGNSGGFLFPDALRNRKKRDGLLKKHWDAFLRASPDAGGHNFQRADLSREARTLLAIGYPPFVLTCLAGKYKAPPPTRTTHKAFFQGAGLRVQAPAGSPLPPPRRGHLRKQARAEGDFVLFDEIDRLRLSMDRNASMPERRRIAGEIRARIEAGVGNRPNGGFPDGDPWTNIAWYAEWLAEMIADRKLKPNTALTYSSSIAERFEEIFLAKRLDQWLQGDWEEALARTMEDHETDGAVKGFKSFAEHLVSSRRIRHPGIDWKAKPFRKARPFRAFPLVGFDDFDKALSAIPETRVADELVRVIRILMIFGFFMGMRVKEAAGLSIADVHPEGEYASVWVRESKSDEGIRKLHLRFLVPEPYLGEVLSFHAERVREARGNRTAPFLTTPSHGDYYDTSYLSSIAGLALRVAIPESFSFHFLRHSFASWFLLRWLAAIGRFDPGNSRFAWAKAAVFSPPMLGSLRTLLLGLKHTRKGGIDFSHALVFLAVLMGHLDPKTTVESYLHTVEVVYGLLRERDKPSSLRMNIGEIARVLDVSYKSVPANLKEKREKATAADILEAMLGARPRRGPQKGRGGRKRRRPERMQNDRTSSPLGSRKTKRRTP
jgi:integrase